MVSKVFNVFQRSNFPINVVFSKCKGKIICSLQPACSTFDDEVVLTPKGATAKTAKGATAKRAAIVFNLRSALNLCQIWKFDFQVDTKIYALLKIMEIVEII